MKKKVKIIGFMKLIIRLKLFYQIRWHFKMKFDSHMLVGIKRLNLIRRERLNFQDIRYKIP